ncbi:type II toxin-antitoxin system PemK/MazF family toxin [Dyadobacter arcticus]|uniref:mRNA interferase n=1 Tax=Dyadobacter arcticus TaxID=1078754 RepID=A0ABX0UQY8_9BACT|nr:type II toxin-antitoxin system PemK/MazF family toxin [Dyadobacter arcticus]NIJ54005.1 mRNA interferase MazF [Dyadobacter arcticus]
MVVKRFEIYYVNLNPIVGSEIKKIRPCLVISPDDVNKFINTVIVAPLTSTFKSYPTRINCQVDGKAGQIAIDQMRAVDKVRLIKKIGILDEETSGTVLKVINEFFA